mmetsp:Transcript_2244/g.2321  ORF Transcript_2244/g.2321 Transcript_2244/m.2321 type:complete len:97 (-) Transcript_2244:315-605(-)
MEFSKSDRCLFFLSPISGKAVARRKKGWLLFHILSGTALRCDSKSVCLTNFLEGFGFGKKKTMIIGGLSSLSAKFFVSFFRGLLCCVFVWVLGVVA